ncbi:FixH family protein [Ferrovibrio xuzhouensis]|uniref:FixH family protein n=1 Tax=Ferrovibrio xuzhouensis TaxID=1576914 RepID=A0ABV7VBI1_9PROT
MALSIARSSAPRGRWIPWLFVAGFGVIIAVNATLIVFAARTFSGLVVENPYQKGLEYNAEKAQIDRQGRLGWQYLVVAAPQTAHAGAMDIELHWTDAARAPLDNLVISGHLERPVENLPPLQVAFTAVGGGRYRSTVVLPERGAWDLYVTAARGSDSFEAAERLIMP